MAWNAAILQTTTLQAVTQIRGSGDYAARHTETAATQTRTCVIFLIPSTHLHVRHVGCAAYAQMSKQSRIGRHHLKKRLNMSP